MSLYNCRSFQLAYWQDFELISVTNLKETADHRVDLDIKRISRNVYGLTGTSRMVFVCDLDVEVSFWLESFGRYVTTPYQIPRQSSNEVYNNLYVKYVMQDVGKYSDLPQVEEPIPEEMCRLFENVSVNVSLRPIN